MPNRAKKQKFRSALQDAWQHKRGVMLVYIFLRLSVILVLVAQLFNRNFENVFLCVLVLFLFSMPTMLERRLSIELPDTLEIIILYWDTVLHTLNGFLCAAIGFSLLDLLNRQKKVTFQLSPLYLAVVAFCFSMTVGVVWEFFECAMDQLFFLDMQKDIIVHQIGSVKLDPTGGNTPVHLRDIVDVIVVQGDGTQTALGLGGYLDIGLLDTMMDLFVNFVGALVFSIIGFFYVRSRGKSRFAKRFIPIVPDAKTASDSNAEDAKTSDASAGTNEKK